MSKLKHLFPFLLILGFVLSFSEGANAQTTSKHYGPESQAITVPALNPGKPSNTYVFWWQMGDGSYTDPNEFRALSDYNGYEYSPKQGTYPLLYPVKKSVAIKLDYENYVAMMKWTHEASMTKYDTVAVDNV